MNAAFVFWGKETKSIQAPEEQVGDGHRHSTYQPTVTARSSSPPVTQIFTVERFVFHRLRRMKATTRPCIHMRSR
jgi:hypothetical protein